MTQKIIELKDISDSRELLEAKEPNFIVIIIYLTFVLMVSLFVWMWFGEIDVTINVPGVLRPAERISVIRDINGGILSEICFYDGKKVKKGDVLYEKDSTLLLLKEENLVKERVRIETELMMLKKLEDSINKGDNLIDEKKQEYYNRYLVFKYNYDNFNLLYNQAKERYLSEKKLPSSATTKNRLLELETQYIISQLNRDEYKRQELLNIKNEMKTNEVRLEQINNSLKEIEIQKEFNVTKAPISGVIQVIQDFNEGEYIPTGMEILRIIPDNGNNYKVELTVQNKDISQLEVGQKVKYNFLALPYREYGTLNGEITKISSDAIMQEGRLIYKIESSIANTELYDKRGEVHNVKPGMKCEAWIVVKKKKLLYYILEKLNLLF